MKTYLTYLEGADPLFRHPALRLTWTSLASCVWGGFSALPLHRQISPLEVLDRRVDATMQTQVAE